MKSIFVRHFKGRCKNFLRAKSMFEMAREEPECVQDFYEHLAKEGALEEKQGKLNKENQADCVIKQIKTDEDIIKIQDRDDAAEEESNSEEKQDRKHEVKFIENNHNNCERHEFKDRRYNHDPECKNNQENNISIDFYTVPQL